ncbi:sugar phosphate isomerase/epimerase family protein [Williamsia muralis]|uniref:Xylose isomerase n=1 Tax=Williamsia marianensis TaxID=85044 RepID=A0A2G3PUL6_WILMA|nr:sugar phosphate isomerase/epimerase [Williamsia marianensis]PHV68722.1 hypothetical protein CSW57_06010 [Williamsia marianensis]
MSAGLAVFQSLWAMEDLPSTANQWSLPEQIHLIAAAGFNGVAVDLGARRAPAAAELAPLIQGSDLNAAVFAFVHTIDDLRAAIAYAHQVGAGQMVVCAQIYGFDPEALAGTVARWYELCRDEQIDMQLETHRNTVTNDIRFTELILRHLDPRIELAGDLSHYVCANEMPDEPTREYEDLVTAILDRCGSLQGRIATRAQVQIPLGTPAGERWEQRFRGWWEQGFRSIRARSAPGRQIMFCTELGTRPYAITDAAGAELSDRWTEALILKSWAHEAFEASGIEPSSPPATSPITVPSPHGSH